MSILTKKRMNRNSKGANLFLLTLRRIKYTILLYLLAALFFMTAFDPSPECKCPKRWKSFESKCYFVRNREQSWKQAKVC